MGDDFSVSTKWNQPPPTEKLGDSTGAPVTRERPFRRRKRREGEKFEPDAEGAAIEEAEEKSDEKQSGKVLDIIV